MPLNSSPKKITGFMNRSLCFSQRPCPYLAMCLLHIKLTVYAYFSVELCPLCVSLLPPLPLSPDLASLVEG